MQAEELLIQWGAWAQVHAKAYGWTSADVLDPENNPVRGKLGTSKILAELMAREGSYHLEQDCHWAVYQINPECRKVIMSRYLDGRNHKESAKHLKITLRQLFHRLERGKRLLMKHFALRREHRRLVTEEYRRRHPEQERRQFIDPPKCDLACA